MKLCKVHATAHHLVGIAVQRQGFCKLFAAVDFNRFQFIGRATTFLKRFVFEENIGAAVAFIGLRECSDEGVFSRRCFILRAHQFFKGQCSPTFVVGRNQRIGVPRGGGVHTKPVDLPNRCAIGTAKFQKRHFLVHILAFTALVQILVAFFLRVLIVCNRRAIHIGIQQFTIVDQQATWLWVGLQVGMCTSNGFHNAVYDEVVNLLVMPQTERVEGSEVRIATGPGVGVGGV